MSGGSPGVPTTPEVSPSPSFERVTLSIERFRHETCAHAVATSDPSALVAAFINARMSGRGAEGCLTRDALSTYCSERLPCADVVFMTSSPGPICLYRCNGYHITGFDEVEASRDASGTIHVHLSATLDRDKGNAGRDVRHAFQSEALTIGADYPFQSNVEAMQVFLETATSL